MSNNTTLNNKPYPHICKAFGVYETNCYIVQTPRGELVIDPGIGSSEWVLANVKNPLAILITHGHFDHIFDTAKLHENLKSTPIYCPSEDAFMMKSDCFDTGLTPCVPSVEVPCKKGREDFSIDGICFSYLHFPGHTPGCSIVCVWGDSTKSELSNQAQKSTQNNSQNNAQNQNHTTCPKSKNARIYSGDFVFHRSIGRYDFPYSSQSDMADSLRRFRDLDFRLDLGLTLDESELEEVGQIEIFPGHGESSILAYEQRNVNLWLERMD